MKTSKLQSSVADHAKLFRSTIERFRYQYDIREVFRDWTELAAAELHQLPYHARLCKQDDDFERVEAEYLAAAKRYERDDFDTFAELLSITRSAFEVRGYQDFLGSAYMGMEISNEWVGQFFTPYEVSTLIAQINLGDVKAIVDGRGYFTLHEPACGSGGMIIAAAEVAEQQGVSPESLFFQAVDVDRLCANMAYIQTSLLGLCGVVWHGNTLTMEMRSYRYTPAARLRPWFANQALADEPVRGEPDTTPAREWHDEMEAA